jgi:anti-sigma-K factor RskA
MLHVITKQNVSRQSTHLLPLCAENGHAMPLKQKGLPERLAIEVLAWRSRKVYSHRCRHIWSSLSAWCTVFIASTYCSVVVALHLC